MTKKFFCSETDEFAVAVSGEDGFVSIESGKQFDHVRVVYTGKELDYKVVVERARKNGVPIEAKSASYTLSNVVKFKIGKLVSHRSGTGFSLQK